MPGFVNAHTHLELTHFPAWRLRNGLDYHPHRFVDWIIQMIKVRRGVTLEETRTSLKAGINACLRSGTTAVGDIMTSPDLLAAYAGSAIGGRLYLELIGQDRQLFEPRLTKAVEASKAVNGGRLPGLSPHAPYTLHSNLLPDIAAAADQMQLPLSLHLAESREESDLLFDSSGPLAEEMYPLVGWQDYLPAPRRITPARFFDAGGLLGPSTLAVHGVQLTPADAALLKERGVAICLCPRSNERLAVGTAPVHLFNKLGIPLCLGTDSLASNDSLSLWDEIRFALDSYKGALDPEELLVMATRGGAAGIGLADHIGSLETGMRADFQVLQLDGGCTADRLLEVGRVNAVYLNGVLTGIDGFSCSTDSGVDP
ncbi:MAG: amidohydrolase family protein [Trichlorobacter sp.]|uniref:amidohydrolase family protein n=1 Tax=Trichlorobacter sp. TaxID=2911007 RepID=UPI0025696177|nr:amidohydrolase family protein [Trichlorobacter sp.]MDK9718557.1 amidohydrolase family protein [Trichlorobacter sp.]